MNRTLRRAATVSVATGSSLLLLATAANAHFCYRDEVPAGSQMVKGAVWMSADDKADQLAADEEFVLDVGATCAAGIVTYLRGMPDSTVFLGPGLLAGGAAFKGKAPGQFGYLIFDIGGITACAGLEP